ncbi:MAG: hypothetical protein M3Y41_18235 [Pseudomonadota bacterium]|nr:hypothetical protein [Pseudomonadota bacterium]
MDNRKQVQSASGGRGRRFVRGLQSALIGWPERPNKPWEHQASYQQWLRDNKYPKPVRDFLMFWWGIVFVLVCVVGGLMVLLRRTFG